MISLKYDENFKRDLMGGIVAGVVALPVALAFGVQSGSGPTAVLHGAFWRWEFYW
jgi:SulP family sulfate permease